MGCNATRGLMSQDVRLSVPEGTHVHNLTRRCSTSGNLCAAPPNGSVLHHVAVGADAQTVVAPQLSLLLPNDERALVGETEAIEAGAFSARRQVSTLCETRTVDAENGRQDVTIVLSPSGDGVIEAGVKFRANLPTKLRPFVLGYHVAGSRFGLRGLGVSQHPALAGRLRSRRKRLATALEAACCH